LLLGAHGKRCPIRSGDRSAPLCVDLRGDSLRAADFVTPSCRSSISLGDQGIIICWPHVTPQPYR
jgi:hypothetical protein